jgi:hypothetical protein
MSFSDMSKKSDKSTNPASAAAEAKPAPVPAPDAVETDGKVEGAKIDKAPAPTSEVKKAV